MADYKGIQGFNIQSQDGDPDNPIVGDLYYNTQSGEFKAVKAGVGVWSSGGNINVVRRSAGTFGTQTASVMVGGESPPVGYIKTTIEYDGTSWTLGNDSSRPGGFVSTGAGILTAGWIAGGYTNAPPAGNQANTEHYNGTTWTEVADLSAARVDGNTVGTTTAGLFSGGGDPNTDDSEEWNGSSGSEGNDMNTARKRPCGMNVGTQTAAACIGGDVPPFTANVENYNGTSWTEVTDMGTARGMGGAFGTTTAFAVAGGSYPAITTTEIWDGTSFSTGNAMAQARSYQPASGNSSTSGLYGGGAHPGSSANLLSTEEWTVPDSEIKTVTTS